MVLQTLNYFCFHLKKKELKKPVAFLSTPKHTSSIFIDSLKTKTTNEILDSFERIFSALLFVQGIDLVLPFSHLINILYGVHGYFYLHAKLHKIDPFFVRISEFLNQFN
ncbi:hypothetical protein BpHYR1_016912 [Brachionus plicatilis]|uniref:Uncharacterized protein n=1 Tax=Brachionus plicatilis TaxID=10195 RepID=A0A3M7SFA5_BRAPC|nr:hypothetical protein BpHYR1_016912 [Brachionus plicatilis]